MSSSPSANSRASFLPLVPSSESLALFTASLNSSGFEKASDPGRVPSLITSRAETMCEDPLVTDVPRWRTRAGVLASVSRDKCFLSGHFLFANSGTVVQSNPGPHSWDVGAQVGPREDGVCACRCGCACRSAQVQVGAQVQLHVQACVQVNL